MSQKTLLKQVLFGRIQRYIWLCLFLVVFSFVSTFFNHPQKAEAATSGTMNFQARLMQSSGALVPDGYYNVEFKLYNTQSSSGSSAGSCSGDSHCVWTETYKQTNRVRVANGYLTVNLGALTGFSGSINWDQEHWLTMNIGGTANTGSPSWDGEMTPRLKLTAVPYAFAAGKLQQTNGGNTSTLGFATQTGSRSILLPDESGTVCLQSSANCGFVAGSASNFLQNGTSPQTADFNITGSGTIGGNLTVDGDAAFNATTTFYQSTPTSSPTVYIQGGDGQASDLLYASDFEAANAFAITRDATLRFKAAAGGINILVSKGASSANRFELNANGRLSWGDGTGAVDTNLYRSAANTLKTDDALIVSGDSTFNGSINTFQQAVGGADSTVYIQGSSGQTGDLLTAYNEDIDRQFSILSDASIRLRGNFGSSSVFGTGLNGSGDSFQITANGTLKWGDGTGTDTNLYRAAANRLKTDDDFQIGRTSTTAFQVQKSTGETLLNVDTTNMRVGIGTATPKESLQVMGSGVNGGKGRIVLGDYCSEAEVAALTCNTSGTNVFLGEYYVQGSSNPSDIDTDILQLQGRNGLMFTTGTGADKVNLSIDDDGAALFKNTNNSAAGFQVQDKDGVAVLTADTSTNRVLIGSATSPSLSTAKLVVTVAEIQTTLRVGDATNGISFNDTATGASGQLRLYGNARNTKKITLTPEFAGAVLSGSGSGSMTAGYDGTAKKNYYRWTSTQTSDQTYEVVIQVPLPSDWSAWVSSNPIAADAWTSSTSNTAMKAIVLDTGGTADSGLGGASGMTISPGNNTWATTTSSTPAGTYAADGIMTIRVTMTAKNSANLQLGNITLAYLSKF
jgi:hypothetical protein